MRNFVPLRVVAGQHRFGNAVLDVPHIRDDELAPQLEARGAFVGEQAADVAELALAPRDFFFYMLDDIFPVVLYRAVLHRRERNQRAGRAVGQFLGLRQKLRQRRDVFADPLRRHRRARIVVKPAKIFRGEPCGVGGEDFQQRPADARDLRQRVLARRGEPFFERRASEERRHVVRHAWQHGAEAVVGGVDVLRRFYYQAVLVRHDEVAEALHYLEHEPALGGEARAYSLSEGEFENPVAMELRDGDELRAGQVALDCVRYRRRLARGCEQRFFVARAYHGRAAVLRAPRKQQLRAAREGNYDGAAAALDALDAAARERRKLAAPAPYKFGTEGQSDTSKHKLSTKLYTIGISLTSTMKL